MIKRCIERVGVHGGSSQGGMMEDGNRREKVTEEERALRTEINSTETQMEGVSAHWERRS